MFLNVSIVTEPNVSFFFSLAIEEFLFEFLEPQILYTHRTRLIESRSQIYGHNIQKNINCIHNKMCKINI